MGGIEESLPELAEHNRIAEPERKDTCPAAIHAAWFVERRHPGATLTLLPADHLVEDVEKLVQAVEVGVRVAAEESGLVCLGVPPHGPSSSYGYIECSGAAPGHAQACRVARFVEKPDHATAEGMLATGRCLWNAGIFVWRAADFLEEVGRVSPEMGPALALLERHGDAMGFFRQAPRMAVDRAVLERTERSWVVGAQMRWDDLGDWEALSRHLEADREGNLGSGGRLALDARNCITHSPRKPVVLLGVEGLIVVDCEDVLLVARRADAQRLREVPPLLEASGREDLV
jgi:mannose-1-phosphate guanylyltransferase